MPKPYTICHHKNKPRYLYFCPTGSVPNGTSPLLVSNFSNFQFWLLDLTPRWRFHSHKAFHSTMMRFAAGIVEAKKWAVGILSEENL